MVGKNAALGSAVSLARGGHAFKDLAVGAKSIAEPFYFGFAGGFASGTVGTYAVYCSHDNELDPYEPLNVGGIAVEVVVASGSKEGLPDGMFNAGWCKLVGATGTVTVSGVG